MMRFCGSNYIENLPSPTDLTLPADSLKLKFWNTKMTQEELFWSTHQMGIHIKVKKSRGKEQRQLESWRAPLQTNEALPLQTQCYQWI